MNKKYDYDALEREYVSGSMSLRELAKTSGMSNHSLLMAQSQKRGWVQKREDYRAKSAQRAMTAMASDEGRRIAREAQVRDNAIDAIDELITRLRGDLKRTKWVTRDGVRVEEPFIAVTPQHVANMIDRLQVLFGKPSTITEERTLGLSLAAHSDDPEFLRALVEATRGDRLDEGSSFRSPLPRLEDPRPN